MWRHQSVAAIVFLLLCINSFAQPVKAVSPPKKTKPTVFFELEFIPGAELFKTANLLRIKGFDATVITDQRDSILIKANSYNKTLEDLTPLVPNLPDIARMIWRNGDSETELYRAHEADLFVEDHELTDNLKVLKRENEKARFTIVLRDDKSTVIKYQSLVRKIEKMGYHVTFAEGYMDAGWIQVPAIEVQIPNNILSFKRSILELSEIPEINRFLYNRGKNPNSSEYILTFAPESDMDLQLSKLLANGIEVYKIDKLLNRVFIHFPMTEARNKIRLEQIKMFDDLITVKNIHENQYWMKPEYSKNMKHIWIDIPEDVLRTQNQNEYFQSLLTLAREEVGRLKQRGMIVVNYGVYTEAGEMQIPEIVFTHRDEDSPKANDILKFYKTSSTPLTSINNAPKTNTCAQLFAL